jgi:hypothetical protein
MRLAGGMLLMLGLGACGGQVDEAQTVDAASAEAAPGRPECPPSDVACLSGGRTDGSTGGAVQDASTSDAESCDADDLLCATSCNPPVYRCQFWGLECTACPPDNDAGAEAASQAPIDGGTDGATCNPGEILCPLCGLQCFVGSRCPPAPACVQ